MKLVCVTLFVCVLASAEQLFQIEGEVVSTEGNLPGIFRAQLEAQSGAGILRTPVTPDGHFHFLAIPTGNYTLRILDSADRELAEQGVSVYDQSQRVTVSLRESGSPRIHQSENTVTVAELKHKPNKRAKRAAEDSEKFAAQGDHQRAAAALEKAIGLDPLFVWAHGNLGAEYLLLHRFTEAAAELQRAATLDPAAAWLQANLAIALFQSGNPDQAEESARRAVALDSRNAKSRYTLGWILLRRPGRAAEGVRELERATSDFPQAHFTLADYYRAVGDTAHAKRELESFLSSGAAANRTEIEGWIAALR
ncbi:MAG: hypothetical protein C5B51_32550 [Terriglobia bacterium]|nr:MAG: hypothetical protein C5B51_32550 [Terriglobia bacterium]